MRKIVINGELFVSEEIYGIARHTFELLIELDRIVPSNEVEVFAPKCDFRADIFQNIKFTKMGKYTNKNKYIAKIYRVIWRYIFFPAYCLLKHALSVNTFLVWKYYNFEVMSIYDCTPDLFPDFFSLTPEQRARYDNLLNNQHRNSKACKLILTDSQSAKEDIIKVYKIAPDKVESIYCGWQHFSRFAEDESVLERHGLAEKSYFFSLGSRLPHKNIKWVSCAAKKHPQYKFVVTGSKHGNTDMSYEGEIPENMIFTGYLKDEEIKALMRHCKAFIQPSFYEGFGLPPLEAMSVGADCIVSNKGSLPEVYKNSVWYIDPYDYDNINLDEIMSRPKESNDVILNEYSWEKSARKLWDTLQKLANE